LRKWQVGENASSLTARLPEELALAEGSRACLSKLVVALAFLVSDEQK